MIDPLTTLAVAAMLALTAPAPAPTPVKPANDLSRPATALTSPVEWVTPDDYPAAAISAKQQGTSSLIFRVLPSGRVGACDIESSSGSDLLDAMACALVKTRARYTPELDSQGRAVESASKTLRFTWKLPERDPNQSANAFGTPFRFEMEVDLDAAGAVVDCRVVARTGGARAQTGDPCLQVRADANILPFTKDGKLVPSRMTFVSTMTHTPR